MNRISFNRRLAVLRNRNIYSFSLVFLLGGICALLYYFGELVNSAGWDALRWEFFYSVHDTQRLFFFVPIIYAGYVFGVRAALIVTIFSACTMIFRALLISPFPDPILRPAIFCIFAGAIGYLVAKLHDEAEKPDHVEAP